MEKEVDESSGPERRSFLEWALGGWLAAFMAAIIYPVLRFVLPPPTPEAAETSVTVGEVDQFPPNSGTIFRLGSRPGILVRTPSGEFRAFSAVCTHLGCTVQYRSDLRHIWCACHNGHYDLHGRNIAGPPPRPLEHYDVVINKTGEIVVRKRRQQA